MAAKNFWGPSMLNSNRAVLLKFTDCLLFIKSAFIAILASMLMIFSVLSLNFYALYTVLLLRKALQVSINKSTPSAVLP